ASSLQVHNLTLFHSHPTASMECTIENNTLTATVKTHNLTTLSMYAALQPTIVLLNGSAIEPIFEQGHLTIPLEGKLNKISISYPSSISIGLDVLIESRPVQFILPSLAKYLLRYSPFLTITTLLAVGLFYFFLHRRELNRLPYEERQTHLLKELERIQGRHSTGEIPYYTYRRMKEEIRRKLSERPKMEDTVREILIKKLKDLEDRYRIGEISYQRYLSEKKRLEASLQTKT
ncbi:MAG: hypothetical protein ACETV1_09075, partial [Candidatus Bathyarchaeia archaeon]